MIHTTLPVAQIVNEYKTGASMKSLAEKHSVSYGTIRNVLAANQVPLRKPGRPSPATMHDTRHVTAYQYRRPRKRAEKLPSEEITRLRRAVGWDESWNEGS